ncbi:MAG: insulinase family protein, partial [Victivallaceae bacterium]|nr:insulinase family protein [Victivallaceae bacterium]
LSDFHGAYYVPNNIVVAAGGNVSHQEVVDLARKKTSRFAFEHKISPDPVVRDQNKPRAAFYHRQIEQMHLALGMLGLHSFDEDRHALILLNVILGGNMSSRLFNEVREKRGLAYSIHSSMKTLADTGLFLIRAGVDNEKVTQALDIILKELKKISVSGVTHSEFSRAKEYVVGQLLLGLEDTMEHMLWIGESTLVRDRIRTSDEVVRSIKRVKIDDIQRVAQKILDEKRYNLTVVGPLKEHQEKKMRQLLGIAA